MAKKEVVRHSVLGALLAAWWTGKQHQAKSGKVEVGLSDALIVAGLGLAWALDKWNDRDRNDRRKE